MSTVLFLANSLFTHVVEQDVELRNPWDQPGGIIFLKQQFSKDNR